MTSSPQPLPRSWARSSKLRRRAPPRRKLFSRVTAWPQLTRDVGEPMPGDRSAGQRQWRPRLSRLAHRVASALERGVVSHAGPARQPRLRAGRIFAARGCARSRPACRLELRSKGRCGRALYSDAACGRRSRSCASRASTVRWKWPLCSPAAGFDAYDVHMTDILAGRVHLGKISRTGCVRRFFLWRCFGCGRRMGEVHFIQRARAPRVCGFLRAKCDLYLGCLQRLSNVVGAQGIDSGCGEVAAIRAQPIGAV